MIRKLTLFITILALASGLVLSRYDNASAQVTNPQLESVGVEGRIPTSAPKVAATITSPSNGQSFTTLPIKVAGLCPEGLLVKIFKNNVFSGSAQCVNGSYSITIDLFNGTNELVARVYDALDQAGPDSNIVTVTFTESGFSGSGSRISLTSSYAKRGANPNEILTWPVILSGGNGPYAISIDWGDGKNDLMSREFAGAFDIKHTYDSAGVYTILIKATDANGITAYLQVVGVANGPIAQDSGKDDVATVIIRERIIWWPLIVAAALICVSFWLGGKAKLLSLRRQAEKRIQY